MKSSQLNKNEITLNELIRNKANSSYSQKIITSRYYHKHKLSISRFDTKVTK